MTGWIKDLKDLYNNFKSYPGKRSRRQQNQWADCVPLPVLILIGRLNH